MFTTVSGYSEIPPVPERRPHKICAIVIPSQVLSLQPRVASGAGQSQEEVIMGLCKDILAKMPEQYDMERVQVRWCPYLLKFLLLHLLKHSCQENPL